MTIRRGGFRPRSRIMTDWGIGPQAQNLGHSSTAIALWSSGTTPAQNLTLLRTRGFVSYILTSAAAVGDGFLGASGIYMMTEDAFAIGATAALNPLSDANSDMWIWHSFFDVRAITATLADGVNAGSAVYKQVIDSKAMRKDFDPERVMVGVTGVIESGTAVMEVNADTRQLFRT